MIRITSNINRFIIPRWRRIIRGLQKSCREGMEDWAKDVQQDILDILEGNRWATLHKRTGYLKKHQYLHTRWNPRPQKVTATFYSTDEVGAILQLGTKAYPITPRGRGHTWTDVRGKTHPGHHILWFTWQGQQYHARRVERKPLKPIPYTWGPMRQRAYQLPGYIEKAVQRNF